MTTQTPTRPVGRTTSLKRVRTTTAQAIAQTVTDPDATWIDRHDQIVNAGLQALGYPPLQPPTTTDS